MDIPNMRKAFQDCHMHHFRSTNSGADDIPEPILQAVDDIIHKMEPAELKALDGMQIVRVGETVYFGPEVTRSGLLILPATLHTESRRRIRTEIALGLAAVVLNVPYDEDSPKVLALAEKWGAEVAVAQA